ncbi:hypothetical protein SLS58_006175 [Diplodia intermedia]|uniref:DUF2786 domain-containing protein n=1 Tax=Diplodia intermedia TaxID=856260 RepID=A0ABR3TP79_9PEZI
MAYPILLGIPIFGHAKADRSEEPVPTQQQPIQNTVSEKSTMEETTSNYRPPRASPASEDDDDVRIASKGTHTFSYWPLRTASAPPEDDQDSIFRPITERRTLLSRNADDGLRHVSPAGRAEGDTIREASSDATGYVVQDAPVRTHNNGLQRAPPALTEEDKESVDVAGAENRPLADDDDDDIADAPVMGDFNSDHEDSAQTHAGRRRFDCTSGLGGRGNIDKGKERADSSVLDLPMRSSGGGTTHTTPDPSDEDDADHVSPYPNRGEGPNGLEYFISKNPLNQELDRVPRGTKRPTDPGVSSERRADLLGQPSSQDSAPGDPTQAKRPRLAYGFPPFEEEEREEGQPNRPAQRRRARAPKEPRPAVYRAFTKELYKPPDAKMLRIIRCLEKSKHPNTSEAEGRAALRVAQRLMADNNVVENEVLIHMPLKEQTKRAAHSVACVRRVVENGKQIRLAMFAGELAAAMAFFFDCKSYSTRFDTEATFTFYGISESTALAAIAFTNIHNLIVEWSRSKKGVAYVRSYCTGVAQGLHRSAEKIKAEELKLAERAEAESLAEREEAERAQRQKELDRLRPLPEPETGSSGSRSGSPAVIIVDLTANTSDSDSDESTTSGSNVGDADHDVDMNHVIHDSSSSSGSDSDSDGGIDIIGDIESDINTESDIESDSDSDSEGGSEYDDSGNRGQSSAMPPPPPRRLPSPSPPLGRAASAREETPWQSAGQLVAFRGRCLTVADEYLKEQNVKLKTGRKRAPIKNRTAWNEGKKDSEKINIRE